VGGFFAIVATLIGLLFWDRRTIVQPLAKDVDRIRHVLIEYSHEHPELGRVLEKHGLM